MNEISNVLNSLSIDEKSKSILSSLFEKLLSEIAFLRAKVTESKSTIAKKDQIIEEQGHIIKTQRDEIIELQRQLNMNSNNSSLHQSKDKYKQDKKDDNDKSNRGGNHGHSGTTLQQFIDKSKELSQAGINIFSSRLRIKYNIQYDNILKKAEKELGKHDYDKHHNTWRFLRRLQKDKTLILRFLRHTYLSLTNNEAERSLRPLKIKQKISGTDISMKTMQENLDIRSFISTT